MTSRFSKNKWNLKLLYSSLEDVQIDKDMVELEKRCEDFSQKYSKGDKRFLTNKEELKQALEDFFYIDGLLTPKPILYLTFTIHLDSSNNKAQSMLNIISDRATKSLNKIIFFPIEIGKISEDLKKNLLVDASISKYYFFLKCTFQDSRFNLSEPEEKILNLKRLTSSDMWSDSHNKMLSAVVVLWKGKKIPIAQASAIVSKCKKSDRLTLSRLISDELKKISAFSEAEMNAVVTDKKIEDELRGFVTSYENTVRVYRNDPKTVELLVDIVTKNFPISHRFYKAKTKFLKQKTLNYCDRAAKTSEVSGDFSFEKSKKLLLKIFGDFGVKYSDILKSYIEKGQIDVYAQKGKRGGAYCWGTLQNPTFVLLNHSNDFHSYTTIAHEMGHAFHTELSKPLGPVYSSYSTSLAETASTFFETLAFDAVVETLPEKQKIIALHDKINDDIATVFRQIACFNFEKDIHGTVRKSGFISKESLADLHNKHMKSYLGPVFKMDHDDGYAFVQWSHLRNFFYVYTYAYGLLVSKALMKRYREDPEFIVSIEKFLSAGGKDTPENILKEIGIDITTGQFFQEGIDEIKKDIEEFEKIVGPNSNLNQYNL